MSDLERVLGRSVPLRETTMTGDIAPVMTGGGMNGRPKRPGLVKKDDEKRRRRTIASVLGTIGEAAEEDEYEEASGKDNREGVIPKNAEELDGGRQDPSGLNLPEPKFKKSNPDSPKDDQEALLSPRAALVAPDVTPNSMTEIDPSDVPGAEGETFKGAEATVTMAPPPPEPAPAPSPLGPDSGQDTFTTAMDALLGRTRKPGAAPTGAQAPTPPPPTMESVQPISPEAAAAMFAAPAQGSGGDPLKQGQPMPDPKLGDGKAVCEAFRRFC